MSCGFTRLVGWGRRILTSQRNATKLSFRVNIFRVLPIDAEMREGVVPIQGVQRRLPSAHGRNDEDLRGRIGEDDPYLWWNKISYVDSNWSWRATKLFLNISDSSWVSHLLANWNHRIRRQRELFLDFKSTKAVKGNRSRWPLQERNRSSFILTKGSK